MHTLSRKGEGSVSRRESLYRGAAALALAGLIIKVSNLLVRVPLSRVLDAEGLGIYQMALPAFYALFHIAAGGVPVAVNNLVAEYTAKGRPRVAEQILHLALAYAAVAGGTASAVLLVGAPVLARLLGEPRAYWPLVAVAPAVVLFAADAVYRSYLQGRKLMSPSATGSVLEQATKIVVTLAAAGFLVRFGKDRAAGGAALGITAGAVVSVLYMWWVYRQIRAEDAEDLSPKESRSLLARRMLKMAWPVTLGSVSLPLISLMDVGIVQRGFLKAAGPKLATAMYGYYSGIAVQVVWFPVVLTNALGNALAPVLTQAAARDDWETVRDRVHLGLKATALLCLPCALGLALLAKPIVMLFGEPRAAVPLLYLSPVALLGPLTWVMTAQLHGLGVTAAPMRNMAVTMLIKVGLDALLAPHPTLHVRGVAAASVITFLINAGLNARELERAIKEPLAWADLLKGPLVGSLVMAAAVVALLRGGILPEMRWGTLAVCAVLAPVLYVTTMIGTGTVSRGELTAMGGPIGARLERWLHLLWPWS